MTMQHSQDMFFGSHKPYNFDVESLLLAAKIVASAPEFSVRYTGGGTVFVLGIDSLLCGVCLLRVCALPCPASFGLSFVYIIAVDNEDDDDDNCGQ